MNSYRKKDNSLISWRKTIPISINSAFGDALTEDQIDDTCRKLRVLKDHRAPYGFCTKAVPSEEVFNKLRDIPKTNNLVVRYSLTGLNEGGYSFSSRVKTIEKLNEIFDNVIIVTRPLIKGQNTDKESISKLVEVADNTSKLLITGGFHDSNKRKRIWTEVREILVNLCEQKNVKYFYKSSCASAYVTNCECWVHDLGTPIRFDVLEDLGYRYTIEDDKICLSEATVGDLNFLRMITRSDVLTERLLNGYNLLSFSDKNYKFEVTSSWYSWSRNIPCTINCDYCIIRNIEYLENPCKIGVSPNEITSYVQKKQHHLDMSEFKKGTYINNNEKSSTIGYNQVRTVHKCLTHEYN